LAGNIALMSYAAPLVLFAVAAPAWAVVVAYGLAMACLGFLNPVWETAVQQEVPAEVLAADRRCGPGPHYLVYSGFPA
jgi:hypothetical protein